MASHLTQSSPREPASAPNQWSNSNSVDHDPSSPPSAPAQSPDTRPRARADALAAAIGGVDIETMRDHHLALAMAVIELAADGERPLPWSHDDPTVALLRAAAKLALTAPEATSSAAADLLQRLETEPPADRLRT